MYILGIELRFENVTSKYQNHPHVKYKLGCDQGKSEVNELTLVT